MRGQIMMHAIAQSRDPAVLSGYPDAVARCRRSLLAPDPRVRLRLVPLMLALSCGAPDVAPPNVIVFTLDTLRADALGAYGHKAKPSPNIDALTAQGYRFTRAYTVTPLTIPAHSSLFTSLWPPRHGVQRQRRLLPR